MEVTTTKKATLPTAEEVEAAWWEKVKDVVDSERCELSQWQLLALATSEKDRRRRNATEDTRLAELVQK